MKLEKRTKGRIMCGAFLLTLCLIVFAQDLCCQERTLVSPDSVGIEASGKAATTMTPIHRKRTQLNGNLGGLTAVNDSLNHTLVDLEGDTVHIANMDSVQSQAIEEELRQRELQAKRDSADFADYGRQRALKINPTRSLWLSALCPGLGQVYNRRYWKLPIVVGGFVGLGYAISWNNKMLKDYTRAYNDIMDNDPNTKSYMDFYPPTVKESDINTEWLKKSLKSKKDYFRRNRDLCVISIVGVYLVCMVDAYVDAAMSKFDISDDLSMKVRPTLIEQQALTSKPGVGVACAISF
ncbi:MAG: DUF5683 domain-containing protein [Muribaculaceae bacterium]